MNNLKVGDLIEIHDCIDSRLNGKMACVVTIGNVKYRSIEVYVLDMDNDG